MTLNILQRAQFLILTIILNILGAIDGFGLWLSGGQYRRKVYYGVLMISSAALLYTTSFPSALMINRHSISNKNIETTEASVASKLNPKEISQNDNTGKTNVLGLQEDSVTKPVLKQRIAFPFITAKAHLIVDVASGEILSEHNIKRTFAPASTTKLMTALVALDVYSLNDKLKMTERCQQIDSSKLWLPVGMDFTVKDLLFALLVSSAGDAGCLLASSEFPQDEFIEKMNEKAHELGMKDTNFKNPVGLDGVNGSHYSTVWDLHLLSSAAMENPVITQIVKTKEYSFSNTGKDIEVNISNTNKLLWNLTGSVGIKTGTTSGAGEVLIYQYKDDQKEIRVIVMSSEDRFAETKELVEWTLSSYEWK